MIDYIKAELIFPEKTIADNPLLERIREVNTSTGELIGNRYVAKYSNFDFLFFDSGRVFIQGSLHKLKNNGLYNYDDFYFEEMNKLLRNLSKQFGFDWNDLQLRNVEYGVNIHPPVPSKEIIQGLMFYKSAEFKDVNVKSFKSGSMKRVDLQRFSIKCYDKKAQYWADVKQETFRFEIQVKKMEYLKKFGIQRIEDLLVLNKQEELGNDLLEKWNDILFYDSTTKGLNSLEKNLVAGWSNPRFWRDMRKQYGKSNRKRIMQEVEKMNSFSESNSLNIKRMVANLIDKKWIEISGLEYFVLGPMLNFCWKQKNHSITRLNRF